MANIKFSQLPNLGNISPSTIVPVVDSLTNYTVTAANLQAYVNNTSGNVSGGNINTTGAVVASGNVSGANVVASGNITGGNVSVTGNVAGTYILGNGSLLTGLPATYGNANVAAYLPTFTGNLAGGNATITSNISTGGIKTDNFYYANGTPISFAGTYGDANVATFLPTYTGNLYPGNITSSGNIQASYFVGNGALLTGVVSSVPNAYGVVSANGTSLVANSSNATFTLAAGTNIGITGNAATGTATIAVTGTVANATYATSAGTATTATSATTAVSATTATSATTAGTVTSASQPAITSVGTLTGLTVSGNITGGNVSATNISGNGAGMTGIVTGITAGSGISISGSTGNVTITNTGGGGGGGTSISNGTSNVTIPVANGNIQMFTNGVEGLRINSTSGIAGVIRVQTNGALYAEGAYLGGDYLSGLGNINLYNTGEIQCKSLETSSGNITANNYLIGGGGLIAPSNPPATSTSTGITGQITWSSTYIYVCVGTNQWRRAALSTF